MPKLFDRVKFNTSTTGAGDIGIGSVSSSTFYLQSDVGAADGDTVRYIIVDGTDVEEGTGTIADSVATMQRTVTISEISGVVGTTKLSLSGTAVVALTGGAGDIVNRANNLEDVADADTALDNLSGVSFGADQSLTSAQKGVARKNVGAPLMGHLFGLTLSTAASSSSFSIAAGECADSTGAELLTLSSALTKTTGAWSAGSGNGALDTGTIANSESYHVFLIEA
jgi:hypothetical protein